MVNFYQIDILRERNKQFYITRLVENKMCSFYLTGERVYFEETTN